MTLSSTARRTTRTEDGETWFDDGSAQVRNIRDPGQPTVKEHQEHIPTHRPHRSWCKFCVMERGVYAHRTGGAMLKMTWRECHTCQWTTGFLGRGTLKRKCLLCWSSVNGGTRWRGRCWFRGKGTDFSWIAKRAARFIDQLGHNRVTLRDVTTKRRSKHWRGKKTTCLCRTRALRLRHKRRS